MFISLCLLVNLICINSIYCMVSCIIIPLCYCTCPPLGCCLNLINFPFNIFIQFISMSTIFMMLCTCSLACCEIPFIGLGLCPMGFCGAGGTLGLPACPALTSGLTGACVESNGLIKTAIAVVTKVFGGCSGAIPVI